MLHGESGVGKSWLGDTVPGPRLILDAEGRAKYTPSGPKIVWDPIREAPPVPNGWDTCVVSITEFDVLQRVFDWLRSEQHPFVSVTLDSLMEIQKRCIDKIAGMNQLKTQDWGELLRRLESLVRSYRDLTLSETNPLSTVCFIVGTKEGQDGTRRPLLQGQLALTLPYYLDIVGYMFTQPEQDGSLLRRLLIQPSPGFVAKDNTGGRLPGIIDNPNIASMFYALAQAGKPEQVAVMGGTA